MKYAIVKDGVVLNVIEYERNHRILLQALMQIM